MILNTFNSAKSSLRLKTVLLHILVMSEKFILHWWIDWNLMLNTKTYESSLQRGPECFMGSSAKKWNIGTNWRSASWKTILWNYFPESRKKNDSIKIVLVATHPISNTDEPTESWQLEQIATQPARANKKYKFEMDPMYAIAHATYVDETIKLTEFTSSGKLICFHRRFLWP